jgi:spore coat polysaccharide biosynthesis protein SpsF
MLTAAGRPMVVLAAQRAGTTGAEVVVATSDRPEDDVIARAVEDAGIRVVRGPLDDPLRRFAIATADLADGDVVVRLTADNVVPDGELVSLLAAEVTGPAAYVRVGGEDPAFPYGVAGEAFTVRALREADKEAADPGDREHVTPYVRRVYGDRRAAVTDVPDGWGALRCTVDTFDDYVALSRVLDGIDDPVGTGWRAVCARLSELSEREPRVAPRRGNVIDQGPFVLGTVQLGLAYGAANETGMPDDSAADEVLASAAAAGVSHVDTARAYGESERRIGVALARGLSEHLRVVTKVRPLDDVPADAPPGWGEEAVLASAQTSLRLLGSSSVDALLLHRAADWSRPGVREGLLRLRADGQARLVGASLSSPAELLTLLDDREVGYVQLPFNLLDRRWLDDEVTPRLEARPDVVVTVRSAYLQGVLVNPGARWPVNAGIDQADVTAAVASLVTELGRESAADLCLAWVLGHPWVTSVVVGAETAEQLRESARLTRNPPLSPEEIAHVADVLPAGADDLVDPSRWRTS